MTLALAIGYFFAALAVVGIAYQLIALAAVWRFFARAAPRSAGTEPVTILKPLHGAEPRLVENLASFLAQVYAGPVQMVCGVGGAEDPAVLAVHELSRKSEALSFPRKREPTSQVSLQSQAQGVTTTQELGPRFRGDDEAGFVTNGVITLNTGPLAPGANAKIGNLIAMMPAAMHDVLVVSDSDMVVDSLYLSRILGALEQPGIGAVTCLYAGRGDAGGWSRISAAAMSYTGLPNMVMALATSIAQPCLGSTIAIRRENLAAIGGFERFADVLADDYAIGEAVAGLGLKVAVPPMVLTHACAHRNLAELWHQHLRWSATIRGVAPMRHAGSGVTHALAFAAIAALFLPVPGFWLIAAALAVRVAMALSVNRIAGVRSRFILALPLADFLEFAVFIASLFARKIDWRGSRLRIMGQGRIADQNPSASENS